MTNVEEFSFIASQLAWLETHLRDENAGAQSVRMQGALNALACAHAVIVELSNLGSSTSEANNSLSKAE